MRFVKVESALDWAYRQGYGYAWGAAEEYAGTHGLLVEKEDLGTFGSGLKFVPRPKR